MRFRTVMSGKADAAQVLSQRPHKRDSMGSPPACIALVMTAQMRVNGVAAPCFTTAREMMLL
jgi:hypothetical protein